VCHFWRGVHAVLARNLRQINGWFRFFRWRLWALAQWDSGKTTASFERPRSLCSVARSPTDLFPQHRAASTGIRQHLRPPRDVTSQHCVCHSVATCRAAARRKREDSMTSRQLAVNGSLRRVAMMAETKQAANCNNKQSHWA
jgi:hypothetical protein